MNYVKRFIPLIITGVVTLILTIVLVVLVLKEQKNVDDLEAKVKGNRNKKESIQRFAWKLNQDNVEKSKANSKQATAYRKKVLDALFCENCPPDQKPRYQYPNPKPATMDKIDCTTHLRTEGTKLWNRLTSGRIKVSESVKNFGLPSPDNVLDDNMTDIVYMNLQIIDELTILLSDTSLTELTSLTPNIPYEDDKKEKPILYNKKGDYNYVTYTISGSGDYEQIRRFVNKLSNSKRFLFLLRNMTLEPEERGFGPPSEWKPQMSKDERVMYKTMTQIKFTLTVDYVELVNKASGTTAKSK